MEKTNSTDSTKLRNYLLGEVFNSEKVYEYETLKDRGRDLLGKDYSDGKLSGVMTKLVEKGLVERIGRGSYKKKTDSKINIEEVVKNHFSEAIESIQESIGNINALDLDNKEFETLKKTREIIATIQEQFNI